MRVWNIFYISFGTPKLFFSWSLLLVVMRCRHINQILFPVLVWIYNQSIMVKNFFGSRLPSCVLKALSNQLSECPTKRLFWKLAQGCANECALWSTFAFAQALVNCAVHPIKCSTSQAHALMDKEYCHSPLVVPACRWRSPHHVLPQFLYAS